MSRGGPLLGGLWPCSRPSACRGLCLGALCFFFDPFPGQLPLRDPFPSAASGARLRTGRARRGVTSRSSWEGQRGWRGRLCGLPGLWRSRAVGLGSGAFAASRPSAAPRPNGEAAVAGAQPRAGAASPESSTDVVLGSKARGRRKHRPQAPVFSCSPSSLLTELPPRGAGRLR